VSAQERGKDAAATSDSCPWRTRLPRSAATLMRRILPIAATLIRDEEIIKRGTRHMGRDHSVTFASATSVATPPLRSRGSAACVTRASVHVVEREVEAYD
jgi:hypothetical protein